MCSAMCSDYAILLVAFGLDSPLPRRDQLLRLGKRFSVPFSYSIQNRILDCSSFRSIYPLAFQRIYINPPCLPISSTIHMTH